MAKKSGSSGQKSAFGQFIRRFIFTTILVFATYNIFGYSYYHWAYNSITGGDFTWFQKPVEIGMLLVGLLFIALYIFVITVTRKSLGTFGIILFLILAGVLGWLLWSAGWIDLQNPTIMMVGAQFLLSLLLAVGMVWSIVYRKITGVISTDEEMLNEV